MPKVRQTQHSRVLSDGEKVKVSFLDDECLANASRSTSTLSSASCASLASPKTTPPKHNTSDIRPLVSRSRSGSLFNHKMTVASPTVSLSLTNESSSPEMGAKHNKSDTTGMDGKKLARQQSKRSNRRFHQLFPSVSTDEIVIDSE